MNIVITAGGTTEKIDDVRVISNNSTGRLAKEIANGFLEADENDIENIYYLCGKSAERINSDKVENISIEGVDNLLSQLNFLLSTKKIDAVIHAMAVSDYTVNYILACDETGEHKVDADKKISSEIEEIKIVLKKTPKVIGQIKKIKEDVVLVGFKLLSKVPHEELIDVGFGLLNKNRCDFVMANDLSEITESGHVGYLISPDKSYVKMNTKKEIAEIIVKNVVESVKNKEKCK
ncbi:phosphopantothenoylcysteine decarboxylase domain-containing protein [Anaerovorax odorimutans]|uniref:phosphopantothenoylcysteine decarboxylase domain-containing protein n=1 Tax=Anaerovorax odorimutans TaxID=109327 RepID=UPI0003FB4DD9|nr:phosphopantothenoylcysteine decarboxylase [Anaerovorax odorimutans]